VPKAVLRGKFIVIKVYIKKQENLTSHLQELEKEKQSKPKVCRRKETTKISAEISGPEKQCKT